YSLNCGYGLRALGLRPSRGMTGQGSPEHASPVRGEASLALPAPASLRNIEAIRPSVQRRNRLRSGQRVRDRLEQRLDAEVDESPENLVVMSRHEDARPEQLDELESDGDLRLRDRMALIGHDGDVNRSELLRERAHALGDGAGAVDPYELISGV